MTAHSSRPSRWYREPIVWLVLAIPATAVVAGAVMLVLAYTTWDGLVADDYYERGMQIGRSLARDEEAVRLGIEAALTFSSSPDIVEVRLRGRAGMHGADRLELRFARAAQAGADVTILPNPGADAVWQGIEPAPAPGKWYAELGNRRWRLTAPVWVPVSEAETIVLEPSETGWAATREAAIRRRR